MTPAKKTTTKRARKPRGTSAPKAPSAREVFVHAFFTMNALADNAARVSESGSAQGKKLAQKLYDESKNSFWYAAVSLAQSLTSGERRGGRRKKLDEVQSSPDAK